MSDSTDSKIEREETRAHPAHLARVAARLASLRTLLVSVWPAPRPELILEIGSGHGHFLAKYATLNPERFFVGIDLLGDRLKKAERKQIAAGVGNLRFVKAEATEFLECLPDGVRFSEVLVLFPDPWPKTRHHKNRLIQQAFLGLLAGRMNPGGRLYFRTDHEPYLEWTRTHLSAHPSWRILAAAPWILEEETVFQARAPSFGSLVAELRIPEPAEKQPDSG